MSRKIVGLMIFLWIALMLMSPLLMPANAEDIPWWDQGYQYRRQITFTQEIEGYQYYIELNTSQLISEGKLRSDCGDLRIVWYHDGVSEELDRWIDKAYPCNCSNTRIWFKWAGSGTYLLYYGNPDAANPPSNGSKIFIYFDDFSQNTTDSYTVRARKDKTTVPSISWSQGYVDVSMDDAGWGVVERADVNVTIPFSVRVYGETISCSANSDCNVMAYASNSTYDYQAHVSGYADKLYLVRSDSSGNTVLGSVGSSTWGSPLVQELAANGSRLWGIDETGGVTVQVDEALSGEYNPGFGAGYQSGTIRYYYFLVRKYSYPDPAAAGLGVEETIPETTTTTSSTQTSTTSSSTAQTTTTTQTMTENPSDYYSDLANTLVPLVMVIGVLVSLLNLMLESTRR